ncbi:MAG: HEPN domain-containing protein [Bosea sp. (in: a-proteobacteria)]
MTDHPHRSRRVSAFMQIGAEELEAARKLLPELGAQSMFFLQQAAEKFARALIEADGKVAGTTHNLRALAEILTPKHELFQELVKVQDLSAAATRYRYPTASGRMLGIDADPQSTLRDVQHLQSVVIAFLSRLKMP